MFLYHHLKRLAVLPVVILLGLLLLQFPSSCSAQVKNGFDLSDSLIPASEIFSGGPPRDGIPAIDNPEFIPADRADRWLESEDRVLGIHRNGVAKAYPIPILNWHEIVNDQVGGEPIAVTFCPLCGTGMAFAATIAGKPRNFGVSGLLYNSDVLLYDRGTESLWSQIASRAISGPLRGTELEMVAVTHTTWEHWRSLHPDTRVLSRDTGYRRDYERDPYAGYEQSTVVFFPLSDTNHRYHPKERVIGLEVDGEHKAYPFVELAKSDANPIEDRLAGRRLRVEYDPEHRTGRVLDARGNEIPTVIAFWFAWSAFHPDTRVYKAP